MRVMERHTFFVMLLKGTYPEHCVNHTYVWQRDQVSKIPQSRSRDFLVGLLYYAENLIIIVAISEGGKKERRWAVGRSWLTTFLPYFTHTNDGSGFLPNSSSNKEWCGGFSSSLAFKIYKADNSG